jgi:PAS domain S-box-containing protein
MVELPPDATIKHLAKVVESSDDAIVSKDLNSIITSWNAAAERMFGYTAAEAIGRSIRMIIPADRQTEEDTVLGRIRTGEAIQHFETIRQRKDGTLIQISLTVSPIYDDSGRVIGASKIARDITEQTRLANENARLYTEAQDANRMKDEFLAVLSHELRTPLNAIVGYSRLLRGGILSGEKAERGLEILERNATWLTQIVEDVLDVSRIVSGKIRLDVQPVNLPSVLGDAVATVLPAANAKGVVVQTIFDPAVGPVSGDPDRLQQVVWNLVNNAVKFTPRGGRVQVRLERVSSHVEIIVSDTGVGISADFLPYVFERFRQAEGGTTRKTGGLGLGLAIVRHIVEMHGGTVRADSAGAGQGATFCVQLPLMIVRPEGLDERREHPRTERREKLTQLGDLHGIRVLAIDDEEDALSLLRVVLETAGAEVETLASPRAALERIEAVRPDVLVVDLGMPEMDGFELISRIRASNVPAVRDVPAAALTAFARSEDRTKALRSGFEMHLAKPVDPGELVASVAGLVRRARQAK